MSTKFDDPTLLAVLANRFEAIGREMTNTLLRTARSAVIGSARDFSCSIVTADDRLLAAASGLPVHVFGSHLQTRSMNELHPDIAPGDAFLHNDPFLGNTHHADHSILVPIFYAGRHVFTAVAKAHQADTGNSQPTTYMPFATDIYEEGAVSFPCVRVQRDHRDVDDVIRTARRRIRVPDIWYGDYLAALGAARIAERRITELLDRYGPDLIDAFVEAWLDYSETRMREGIRSRLRSGRYVGHATHDPIPVAPEGIPISVTIDVDTEAGSIRVDLRDNPDCIPAGLNQSEATAVNNVVTGVFNNLSSDIPHNAGSFRCLEVLLRENCIVGIPVPPTSCSMATTNIADRLVNATQSAFASSPDAGIAHGGAAMGADAAVISGTDPRRGDAPFVNQIVIGNNGGGAGPETDGWLTLALPVTGGVLHRDSVEILEEKYPMVIDEVRLQVDGGGAGYRRGAPPAVVTYGPRDTTLVAAFAADGGVNPAQGVNGGQPGLNATVTLLGRGDETPLMTLGIEALAPGERLRARGCGGGGYGDPARREVELVLHDVREGWVSVEAAREIYKVVIIGSRLDDSLEVDHGATAGLRGASTS